MKHFHIKQASLALLFITGVTICMSPSPSYWKQVSIPNTYIAPATNDLLINGKKATFTHVKINNDTGTADKAEQKDPKANSFVMSFPTAKMNWFQGDAKCAKQGINAFASTQTRLRSDFIPNVSGISFLGKITGKGVGTSRENHFSIFFHTQECYDGGPEYGFAFYEDMQNALFYVCGNCNLTSDKLPVNARQTWWDWPGRGMGDIQSGLVTGEEKEKVADALGNPSQERYYNIKVLPSGDFIVEVINPQTWKVLSCTIKNRAGFPNLYQTGGYITINAKRNDDSTANMGKMELKEIKVWQ